MSELCEDPKYICFSAHLPLVDLFTGEYGEYGEYGQYGGNVSLYFEELY